MKKIDADGHVSNEFSDGSPGTSDGTVVDASWLNAVQRELVNLIEAAGLTVTEADPEQIRKAVDQLIANGGSTVVTATAVNNQVSALDVPELIFDKASVKQATVTFNINRNDGTDNLVEVGSLKLVHDGSIWRKTVESSFDESGVSFDVNTLTGQVSYTTTNMPGGSYTGEMRFKSTTSPL